MDVNEENLPAEGQYPCIDIIDAVFTTEDVSLVSEDTRGEADLMLCKVDKVDGEGAEYLITFIVSNIPLDLYSAFEAGYLELHINKTNLNIDCTGDIDYVVKY